MPAEQAKKTVIQTRLPCLKTRIPEYPPHHDQGHENAHGFIRKPMEEPEKNLDAELKKLSATIALLEAQSRRPIPNVSPWLPLKEAASRLNFPSPRVLRSRIKSGQFPPECFRIDPTASGKTPKYLVHVERYIKLLR